MTRIRIFTIMCLLLLTVSNTSQGNDNENYRFSLQECIDFALENNQNVEIAALEADISVTRVGEARSEGLPQVNGLVEFRNNLALRTTLLPHYFDFSGNTPEGEFIPVQFGTPYDGDVALSVSQLLFDASYLIGLKAARTYKELSYKDKTRAEIDAIEQVTKAYYGVLVSKIRLELVEKNYQRLDTLLFETKAMYDNGFTEKINVNRIEVEYNNMEVLLNNTKELLDLSYILLKFQMGMPIDNQLELTGSISDIQPEELAILEQMVNYTDRIEYSSLTTNYEVNRLNMKVTQSRYAPKISAFYQIGINAGVQSASDLFKFTDSNKWFNNEVLGIRMEVPIFDGLMKNYQVQRQRLVLSQLDQQRTLLESSINTEVAQSKVTLTNNLKVLRSQEKNMKLAEDVYNTAKIKYQEGVGSSLEVIDADNAFKEAQTNYFNSLYDALIAKVDLEKALGLLDNKYK